MAEQKVYNLTRLGWGLALPVLFLATVGLACIHSADVPARPDAAAEETPERVQPEPLLTRVYRGIGPMTLRQGLYIATGVALLVLVLTVPYQKLGRYTYVAYGVLLVGLVLLVLDRYVNLPLIAPRNFSRRWIDLGFFSLQPSEFMKPVLIMTLARYLRFRSSYRRWRGLMIPFLLTVVPMALILKQPDLGTTLMLLPVLFAMLFVAGARLRHLLIIVLLGCATMPVFYFYVMKPYQKDRIMVLFKQDVEDEAWHMDQGYQLRQAKIALGTGGVTGTGYGQGIFLEHDSLLPEKHNDFIFAIIGHEWGFIGGVLVILAYSVIVTVGLEVATITNDPFGRLLAIGVVVMIVVQALLNVCMNIGLAPITGMTLPFVSYGGSSMWANFLALGLLVNVAQRRPMLIARPPFEYDDEE